MTIGLIIIGDEILSGKRTDRHIPKLIALLKARGLQLDWVEIIGDQRSRITETLRRSFASDDIVFCCGGIGATPDDHTRQCTAAALGVELALHPEAKRKIQERITDLMQEQGLPPDLSRPEHLQRLKMGEFPVGAAIIPNAFNKIPGFSVHSHYFLPGFPEMAGPMMEWVLDTYYFASFNQTAWAERALLVYEVAESVLAPMMEQIEERYPLVKVFSLPSVKSEQQRAYIDLGVKGAPDQVADAFGFMLAALEQLQAEYTLLAS